MTSPGMLTKRELQTAVLLLNHAATSARWVSTLFARAGDHARAGLMNDYAGRLMDEAKAIKSMVAQAPEEGGHA